MKPGNPNHPVSRFMEDQWQKIAALLVRRRRASVFLAD